MDGVGLGRERSANLLGGIEIRSDLDRSVCTTGVVGAAVVSGGDRDRLDPEPLARPEDAGGDLAAVRNDEPADRHGCTLCRAVTVSVARPWVQGVDAPIGHVLAAIFVAAIAATSAFAGSSVAYGIQDDAWLRYGPGTVEERVATLQGLGLDVVRVTVRWDAIEEAQDTFHWAGTDAVLEQLHSAGIDAIVTLYGTPEWANGNMGPNVAPTRGADFAAFAGAVAERYPFVHRWTIWNEPNQRRWLSTASPAQYVTRLLNPAYIAIHAASPSSKVAGGVTAPRGGTGGLSPVAFIRGMGRAAPGSTPTRITRTPSAPRKRRGAAAAITARRSPWRRSTASSRRP